MNKLIEGKIHHKGYTINEKNIHKCPTCHQQERIVALKECGKIVAEAKLTQLDFCTDEDIQSLKQDPVQIIHHAFSLVDVKTGYQYQSFSADNIESASHQAESIMWQSNFGD